LFLTVVDVYRQQILESHDIFSHLQDEEIEEVLPIFFSNAVAHPWTVMVIGSHTSLALLAMLGPQRLVLVAHRTVSGLYIQDYLALILFLRR
jgi:hypothetical protein